MGNLKRVVLKETETNQLNMSSEVVEKQINKFDNSYTSKKLNDLYNEFDSITFSDEVSNATVIKNNAVDVKASTSFKVKVYLTTAVMITVILAFLAIYNVFVINNLNVGIKMLQNNVAVSEVALQNLQAQTGNLTEEQLKELINETFNGAYGDVGSNGIYELENLVLTPNSTASNSTNWFDSLCSFFSGAFGG